MILPRRKQACKGAWKIASEAISDETKRTRIKMPFNHSLTSSKDVASFIVSKHTMIRLWFTMRNLGHELKLCVVLSPCVRQLPLHAVKPLFLPGQSDRVSQADESLWSTNRLERDETLHFHAANYLEWATRIVTNPVPKQSALHYMLIMCCHRLHTSIRSQLRVPPCYRIVKISL